MDQNAPTGKVYVCVCVYTSRQSKELTVFGLNSPLLAVASFEMPPFALYIPTPSSFQWQYRKRPFVCCMTNGPAATFAPSRHVLHCDTLEKKMSDKIKQKKRTKKRESGVWKGGLPCEVAVMHFKGVVLLVGGACMELLGGGGGNYELPRRNKTDVRKYTEKYKNWICDSLCVRRANRPKEVNWGEQRLRRRRRKRKRDWGPQNTWLIGGIGEWLTVHAVWCLRGNNQSTDIHVMTRGKNTGGATTLLVEAGSKLLSK